MKKERWIFAGIFVLSLVLFLAPIPPSQLESRGFDKLLHITVFASLLASGYLAFPRSRALLVCFLVIYAPLVEWVQKYVFIYRSFDLKDIAADLLGLIIGALVLKILDLST